MSIYRSVRIISTTLVLYIKTHYLLNYWRKLQVYIFETLPDNERMSTLELHELWRKMFIVVLFALVVPSNTSLLELLAGRVTKEIDHRVVVPFNNTEELNNFNLLLHTVNRTFSLYHTDKHFWIYVIMVIIHLFRLWLMASYYNSSSCLLFATGITHVTSSFAKQ